MGNRYIDEFCPRCNEITVWRITRKFGGKSSHGSGKPLKRETRKCLACQYKIIKGRKHEKAEHFVSFRKE